MHSQNAVVIGSGVAGLAAAIRLAAAGFSVRVFEKNEYPGGKLSAFHLNGFQFDAGPSLFTEPWLLQELFDLCGENINDHLHIRKVEKACTYFFPGGKKVEAWANANEFAAELEIKLGEPAAGVRKYLSRSRQLYTGAAGVFLNRSLHKASTWANAKTLRSLFSTSPRLLTHSLHELNSREFKTDETRQIFDRFATYNGSDPYRTPAIMSVIPHLEHNTGIWYPEGGMIAITDALYRLALRQGVRFTFGGEVQRIIHTGGMAKGIVVNGMNIDADVVISNMDVYFTYRNLLKDESMTRKAGAQERSSSALVYYWGIDRTFSELGLHNIFFSSNYKKEFESIFNNSIAGDITVYVNITSKEDPSHAPGGMENWFVMVNVPADGGQNWAELASVVRSSVISSLSNTLGTNVEQHIIAERIMSPLDIARDTMSYRGALYGTSSNSPLAAFLRHPNYSSAVKGLYFCGGSVHPGGGIPLCLRSAAIAADLIKQKRKIESR